MPEPRVNWRSTPRALRSAVQPSWSLPKPLLAHVAELRVDEPWDQYHRWVSRVVALRG